jgi:hypothetical protein
MPTGLIPRDQTLASIMRADDFDRIADNDDDDFKVPPLPIAKETTDGIILQQPEREGTNTNRPNKGYVYTAMHDATF